MTQPLVSQHRLLVTIAIFAIAAVAGALATYLWYFHNGVSLEHADWGEFGDFFGGLLNPVLSFLALLALLGTLYYQRLQLDMQSEQLENSKKELRLTREELTKSSAHQEKSAHALSAQTDLIANQAFDTTFFQLLNLHHQLVNGLELRDSSSKETVARGRDTFVTLYKYLRNEKNNIFDLDETRKIEEVYGRFYEEHGHKIGHYFRNLFRIFKILHESNSPKSKMYAAILRSQLSNHELLLLFYNGLSQQGKKFVTYIDQYALLDNLPKDKFLYGGDEKDRYSERAYGE